MVYEGQVAGLAVVLNRQFVVAIEHQFQRAMLAGVGDALLVECLPRQIALCIA